MKKLLAYCLLVCLFGSYAHAQISVNPAVFTADQAITLTYDAAQSQGQALANLPTNVTTITAHVGAVVASPTSTTWTAVPGAWGDPNALPKFTRQGTSNLYTLTLPASGIRGLFPALVGTTTPIYRLAMVLRENGACGGFGGNSTPCKEGKGTNGQDIFIDISQSALALGFNAPTQNDFFANTNEVVNLSVVTNKAATITFEINGVAGTTYSNVTTASENLTVTADAYTIKAKATAGTETAEKTIRFLRRKPTEGADNFPTYAQYPTAPDFPKIGVNYSPTNNKEVTLVLRAPLKDKVFLVGEFNNWELQPAYQMKRTVLSNFPNNNDFYWLTFEVPTAGEEYAYQFVVLDAQENRTKIADPYARMTLDAADDSWLSTVYPNLKAYPAGKTTGTVSVLQTNQTPYTWSSATLNFARPSKESLVIYELWVYDFSTTRDFQGVIDKLDYLQGMGVNAIELMPITEFAGNISWGYNPRYYMAVDKAYGHRNKLKELVDKCHQRGMAVIVDMVFNHAEEDFPYVQLYPQDNNPFFNPSPTHPFNVFRDFNHDYQLTKNLVKDANLFWLQEYKIDGFRFDLSKGFTQNAQCTNKEDVNCWSAYHADRVATWKRIADEIWAADANAYVILEHLAENSEEKELAEYRVNETPSKGMMFWRNMESNFSEAVMGFNNNTANIEGSIYSNSGWSRPRLIPYMESHDEERLAYKAKTSGNTTQASHNVRTVPIYAERMKAAAAFATLSTGPKMIWQFGEMAYDFSINQNGRTGTKPLPWVAPQNYDTQSDRLKLRKTYAEIVKLKTAYKPFHSLDSYLQSSQNGNQLTKQLKQTYQPYTGTPQNANEMNVVIIGNFDVTAQTVTADFHHTGTWYDYFNGSTEAPYEVTGTTSKGITLKAGEFRIFTDYPLSAPEAELTMYALPAKVGNLTGVGISDTQIKLTWADLSSIETGYRVERSTSLNGAYIQVGNLPAGATTFTDNGLTANTTYFYRVVTLSNNGNKNSTAANAATLAPIQPNAPTNLQVTSPNDVKALHLTWTDNATNELAYRVERALGTAGTFSVIADNLPANTTSYHDADAALVLGQSYRYRVCAVLGSQTGCATASNPTTVTALEGLLFGGDVKVYPNPAEKMAFVQLPPSVGKISIRVLDVLGKEIAAYSLQGERAEIRLDALAKGTYFLEISTDKGKAMKRVVKMGN